MKKFNKKLSTYQNILYIWVLILKTNTMSTFKKAKVVMLPTNKPSKLGNLATYKGKSLAKVIKEGVNLKNTTVQFWTLYIISDDEIKVLPK